MGQREQDEIIGKLYREASEARRELVALDFQILEVRNSIMELVRDLTAGSLAPSNSILHRHASLAKYVNLEPIIELLEAKESSRRKVEEFDQKIHSL